MLMRLPNRKPGKYTFPTFDPQLTQEKLDSLKSKLEHIRSVSLPRAIKETRQYGENGDFSENAEYQIAKGRLRGLLRAADELQHQITHAVIVEQARDTEKVQIGHTVTITSAGKEYAFKILGSSEADPKARVISYTSPLGAALMGHSVGDVVKVETDARTIAYKVLRIA